MRKGPNGRELFTKSEVRSAFAGGATLSGAAKRLGREITRQGAAYLRDKNDIKPSGRIGRHRHPDIDLGEWDEEWSHEGRSALSAADLARLLGARRLHAQVATMEDPAIPRDEWWRLSAEDQSRILKERGCYVKPYIVGRSSAVKRPRVALRSRVIRRAVELLYGDGWADEYIAEVVGTSKSNVARIVAKMGDAKPCSD